MQSSAPELLIRAQHSALDDELMEIAHEFGARFIGSELESSNRRQLVLEKREDRWMLQLISPGNNERSRAKKADQLRSPKSSTLTFDFRTLISPRRLRQENLRTELLLRAVKGRKSRAGLGVGASDTQPIRVIDATAGLGRDAALLAAWGYNVTLLERNRLLCYLVRDAIKKNIDDRIPGLSGALERMNCLNYDCLDYFRHQPELAASANAEAVDVVYLDPMYSQTEFAGSKGLKKSAQVKKEAQALQLLDDLYAERSAAITSCSVTAGEAMLNQARAHARDKVVVKRAPGAPWLGEQKPGYSLQGKSVRFDVYPS